MNSTLLKKYETIDQSKVTEKDKKVLEQLKKLTNNFEETDEAKNKVAEKILNQIELLNPDAIKKPQVVAKTVAKAKKVVKAKKTATTSTAKNSGNNIMSVAKEIQKSGESWKDAMERAKDVLKQRREQVVEKKKTEMEKLLALVRTKKELQGFANSDVERDSRRTALPRGRRISKDGNVYYESRENRTDRLAPNYPQDMPLLASGGSIGSKKYKKGDKITTAFGTYYVDGVDQELQDYIDKHKFMGLDYVLAQKNVNIVYSKYFNEDNEVTATLRSWFDDKKQPTEKGVRDAMIWSYDSYMDYQIKAGGGSKSDSEFSSMMRIAIADANGNDKDVAILKKYSTDFKDVLITMKEIQALEEVLETKGAKDKKSKDKLFASIDFLFRADLIGSVNDINGKPVSKESLNKIFNNVVEEYSKKEINSAFERKINPIQMSLRDIYMGETEEQKEERLSKANLKLMFLENLRDRFNSEKYADGGMMDNMSIHNSTDFFNTPVYANGGSVNMNKHIWEGWTVGDFIQELEPTFNQIMSGRSWQKPFKTKEEVKAWAMDNQPYYKKNIPEVVNYFWTKAQSKDDYAKGGKIQHNFKVGEIVSFPTQKNRYMDKPILDMINHFSNKELVIEKIKEDKPYNLADVYIKDTGEKLRDLILNPKVLKIYPDGVEDEKNVKIKDWYLENYPTDDLGEELDEDATFEDVWTALNKGTDVYSVFGVGDSLVRERIFDELSKIYGVDYEFIYKKWLGSDNYANGGNVDDSWELKNIDSDEEGSYGKVLHNGKEVAYYEFDRYARTFWVENPKGGQMGIDTPEELFAFYKAKGFSNGGMTDLTMQNVSFAKGGGISGKLDSGVYRVGKPTKVSPNLYEQKIVEIFDNGDIALASDYGRKLSDFKSQKYPIITKEQLDSQYKMANGGSVGNDRMYNFLKDDLEELEEAISDGDREEVERFFSYWLGSSGHLKSLETKTNGRMYNFLKDDLEKLEKAVNDGDKEEEERFFSYWGQHLESLKMANGGSLPFMTDPNFGNFQNTGAFAHGGETDGHTLNHVIEFTTSDEDLYLNGNIGGDMMDLIDVKKIGDNKYSAIAKSYSVAFEDIKGQELEDEVYNQINEMFATNDSIDVDLESLKIAGKKFELGGAFVMTDLAGHTGGSDGLGNPMPLSGVSGTNYTGLVGETGAMSSGELFENGGGIEKTTKVEDIKNAMYKAFQSFLEGKISDEKLISTLNKLLGKRRWFRYFKGDTGASDVRSVESALNSRVNRESVKEDMQIALDTKGLQIYNWDGNEIFEAGGAMAQNQQVINDASQSYVNYYLGEGASQGIYKDGGSLKNAKELSEDERFELKVLGGLAGYNDGLNLNGLYESIGFSNYRFNQNATEAQTQKVKKALSSLIEKGFVDESGLGYKITQKGADYRREFDYGSYAEGGSLGKALYVEYSSYFTSNKYDEEKIMSVLEKIGAKNIRLENDRGWFNQPEVVVFNGDKNKAQDALNEAFDTEYIRVSEKDWRTKKMADGGFTPDVSDGTQFINGVYAYGGKTKSRPSMRELYIEQIASLTRTRATSVDAFANENNLTDSELSNLMSGLGRKMISPSDFVTALVGNKNNPKQKEVVAFAKSDKAYKMADGGDVLPPSKTYGENIYKAMQKFNISDSEARKRYGQYTISQWNELLSEKMADGGALKFKVGQGEKYFDKKEKMQLTIGKESDIPNVYNVTWEDGEHSIYSANNINFFISRGIWKKLDKMANGGSFAPNVSNGTEFMNDAYFLGGGQINGMLNKKIQKLADVRGFEISDWATSEYNKIMTQALVESLTDANFHDEAKQVVVKAEGKTKWSDDLYRAESFNPNEEVASFAREVARECDYDGDDIINAYFFITKMAGSKVATMIEDLFLKPKPTKTSSKPKKYIDHDDIKSVTVNYKGKEVSFKGEDVLNGANLMEKGGDLSKIAFYIAKRDVISVELKNGDVIHPVNGYWIKKGAEPMGKKNASTPPKTGKVTSPNYPNVNFNHKVVINGKTINLALAKSYVTGLNGSRQYDFIDVDGNPMTGYGFSVKEALKQVEDFGNNPMYYSQTTNTPPKIDETKAHFKMDVSGGGKFEVFVDSNFVNQSQGNLPNTELKHYGYGDFYLQTPDGNIDFIRTSEEKEGFIGRTNLMKGSDELVLKLVNAMEEKGRFENSTLAPKTVVKKDANKLVAPKGYVFVNSGSHRATKQINRSDVKYISLYSLGGANTSAGTTIMFMTENDYEKIKGVRGVSPAKSYLSAKSQWFSRQEDKKLDTLFREIEQKESFGYADGGDIEKGSIITLKKDVYASYSNELIPKGTKLRLVATPPKVYGKNGFFVYAKTLNNKEEVRTDKSNFVEKIKELESYFADGGMFDDNDGFMRADNERSFRYPETEVEVDVIDEPIDLTDNVSSRSNEVVIRPLDEDIDLNEDGRVRAKMGFNPINRNPNKMMAVNQRMIISDLPKPTSNTHKND